MAEVPRNVVEAATAAALAVAIIDDIEDDALQMLLMIANIAALEWMEMDGDDDVDLDQLRTWENITVNINEYHTFGDYSFKLHFRMSRRVFERLVQTVGDHLVEKGRLIRERRPLQDIVLMVVWILATPDTFRSVALRFGINPGTLYYFYKYIIEALRELAPQFISWPGPEERERIKNVFQRATGFPGAVGCIDGTHVYITRPVRNPVSYRNRHHTYSLNVQTVVDNNLLVRDLYVGEAGSMMDKRVFRRSPLCSDLVRGVNDRLSHDEHLVGDGGYTLTDFMLIPFANNGHLTQEQLNFNRSLSQCRVRVENAYGRAKGKWRRIKMLHVSNEEIAVDHVTASFVLHNFTILQGEQLITEKDLGRPINNNEIINEEGFEDNIFEDVDGNEDFDADYNELIAGAQARGQEKRIFIMQHMGQF
ncbi:Protein ANTAGONIST OF LIKE HETEROCHROMATIN PROTEIN 1 [Frankliniella fusca]|uniref:Protein ANTAGONIST OF LIKE HETEROCHROMATIN PROTEIN 1 n=1 Tax=Frankliniella fusca TaxID=407009 RepID=A0AAE1HY12_9NEOP|nr:Protein ANTAGONIST OF LIKE HETEROCHROMATIN PROTEIN 1 [Frankliniella fusca]